MKRPAAALPACFLVACGSWGTPQVVLSGWTGHGADGEPAAWFHSRGC